MKCVFKHQDLQMFDLKLKRHNHGEIIKKLVFLFWLINMAIRCEHVYRLELRKSFKCWDCCGNVASVPKAPIITGSYSHISYFGLWHVRN